MYKVHFNRRLFWYNFNEEGVCSLCSSNHVFHPYGKEQLIQLLETVKSKKRGEYDALVPLSDGKKQHVPLISGGQGL